MINWKKKFINVITINRYQQCRQSGKTTKAVNLLRNNDNSILFVNLERDKQSIINKFRLDNIQDRIFVRGDRYPFSRRIGAWVSLIICDEIEAFEKLEDSYIYNTIIQDLMPHKKNGINIESFYTYQPLGPITDNIERIHVNEAERYDGN